MNDPEYVAEMRKFRRSLSTAKREMHKAVERASGVDLRPGHVAEARRLTEAIRDEADRLVEMLEKEGAGD